MFSCGSVRVSVSTFRPTWRLIEKKSGLRTEIEWFRPSRNRFPSVSLLHSNERAGKKNCSFETFKKGFFFSFAKLYVKARKILINTVVTAVARWMRLYLLLLFSRRVSDAIFIQRAPLIVHRCLAWRTTSLAELKTRRRPCCLRAFQQKAMGRWWGGGLLPADRTLNNLQLSGLDGRLWKLIFSSVA